MFLNLRTAAPALHSQAHDAVAKGDAAGFVSCARDDVIVLQLLGDNVPQLKAAGIYERCLLLTWAGYRVNYRQWKPGVLLSLFSLVDREKLRVAGDPLPGDGPFHIYRGIAGNGPARRPRGLSWTASLDCACWFALRFGLRSPAVLVAEVTAAEVLVYDNGRNEQEFIVQPERSKALNLSDAELQAGAVRVHAQMEAAHKAMIQSLERKGNRP